MRPTGRSTAMPSGLPEPRPEPVRRNQVLRWQKSGEGNPHKKATSVSRVLNSACAKTGEYIWLPSVRSVAQPGSALDWGSRGRRFESGHSDQFLHYFIETIRRSPQTSKSQFRNGSGSFAGLSRQKIPKTPGSYCDTNRQCAGNYAECANSSCYGQRKRLAEANLNAGDN